MPALPTYWPLATATLLTFALLSGAADARGGGGHGGGTAHPARSAIPIAMPHAPSAGVVVHPASTPAAAVPRAPVMPPTSTAAAPAPVPATLSTVTIGAPAPTPDVATTPSAIAAPMPELAPIAPLSPQLPTQFATGGTTQSSLALSPGSPSESAPSAPGGGGKTLADCMGFWDRETHMTKAEWKAACLRTLQDYPSVR